jgi:hypothetical protein
MDNTRSQGISPPLELAPSIAEEGVVGIAVNLRSLKKVLQGGSLKANGF